MNASGEAVRGLVKSRDESSRQLHRLVSILYNCAHSGQILEETKNSTTQILLHAKQPGVSQETPFCQLNCLLGFHEN